ncbi:MAG TPA: class I SAM-dependent methyltransferase [Dermatophilaceae bacterium]|nr:class I SAM-dependent methyltransferase [Dermatophilaceae bacterium]
MTRPGDATSGTSATSDSTDIPDGASPIDGTNRALYERPDAAGYYVDRDQLQPPERAILAEYAGRLRGARILDLGIGAGRTTGHLLPLAGRYVGIDYSAQLVAAARERFPEADLRVGDARDLGAFADGSVDVVVFSFNGIDYMGHADRLLTLAEIRRVLAPGGLFVFASHNRDWERFGKLPWQPPIRVGRAWLSACLHALRALPRHRRLERLGERTADHAIVNDDAHDYALLTYYIDAQAQHEQLAARGFTVLDTYSLDGRPCLTTAEGPDGTASSCWLTYVAQAQ